MISINCVGILRASIHVSEPKNSNAKTSCKFHEFQRSRNSQNKEHKDNHFTHFNNSLELRGYLKIEI